MLAIPVHLPMDRRRFPLPLNREQRRLLECIQEPIIITSVEDAILFWNGAAERVYGWNAKEVKGLKYAEKLAVDALRHAEALEAVQKEGQWRGEIRAATKAGRRLSVDSHLSLIPARGTAELPLVLALDLLITDKKKFETEFLRSQRMESIGTLASGIAHDLNNILAPILMGTELLTLQGVGAEQAELVKMIAANASRGAELVKQVLSFARGVEGSRINVDVAGVLKDVATIIRETFPKDIRLELQIPQNRWNALADATQIHQVVMNLCLNARDAMPHGGTLSISMENTVVDATYVSLAPQARLGSYVKIEVEDNGSGMPPEVRAKIFDPFYSTKPSGIGTGIGLSTVRSIVRGHKGFIQLWSEPGAGSRFRIFLPAIPGDLAGPAAPVASEKFSGHGEVILVVDDEASVRETTKKVLEGAQYRVELAGSGEEAIAKFGMGRIYATMVDMLMPGLDGAATVAGIRRIEPQARIIACSGEASGRALDMARRSGVSFFLAKPFTTEELLRALREATPAT